MSPEIFLSFNEIFSLIVIVDLCIEFIGMIMVCLHSELHMYNHKGPLLLLNWKLKVCFVLRMLWIFWELRFLHCCWWRLSSCGMLCHVSW